MFYMFRQNNSGGFFDINPDEGRSVIMIVEADNADEANERAEEIGIYFDPHYQRDCQCCGTRWTEAWDDEGTEAPSYYGEPIGEARHTGSGWAGNRPEGFIHYKDGRQEALWVGESLDDRRGFWGSYELLVTPWPLVEGQVIAGELEAA